MPDATIPKIINWHDPQLWFVGWLFISGTFARMLLSPEPFNMRRFVGELTVAGITAVVFIAGGILQGLGPVQLLFYGGLVGLGGLRSLEWALKIAMQLKAFK